MDSITCQVLLSHGTSQKGNCQYTALTHSFQKSSQTPSVYGWSEGVQFSVDYLFSMPQGPGFSSLYYKRDEGMAEELQGRKMPE